MQETNKIARLAAATAISNYGFQVPRHIAENPESWAETAWAEMCSLAGHLMESDKHERMFCEEAESWENNIKKEGIEAFVEKRKSRSPWMVDILEAF